MAEDQGSHSSNMRWQPVGEKVFRICFSCWPGSRKRVDPGALLPLVLQLSASCICMLQQSMPQSSFTKWPSIAVCPAMQSSRRASGVAPGDFQQPPQQDPTQHAQPPTLSKCSARAYREPPQQSTTLVLGPRVEAGEHSQDAISVRCMLAKVWRIRGAHWRAMNVWMSC